MTSQLIQAKKTSFADRGMLPVLRGTPCVWAFINLSLSAHHWHSALVVSDPPHMRRLD